MGAYWVKRAGQFFYASVNLIRTRSATDRLILGSADQGAVDITPLSVDAGGATSRAIVSRGITHINGYLVLTEQASDLTCSAVTLTSASSTLSSAGVYIKNNQLVFAHVCGANGVVNYLKIPLDGLSCTWTQSATAA